jgi:hypothetical protein
MKKIICAVVLCALPPFVVAQTKKGATPTQPDPVEAFELIVTGASTPNSWVKTVQNTKTQKWTIRYFSMNGITYDVKKTDSLVNPIIGVVKFSLDVNQSAAADTQADAESMPDMVRGKYDPQYDMVGTYVFKAGGWHLREFKYTDRNVYSGLRGSTLEHTPENMKKEPNAFLTEALKKWLR